MAGGVHVRSMLFVPVLRERFVERAKNCGAGAVILDLEDSIPVHDKSRARAALPQACARLKASGLNVAVRVNRGNIDDATASQQTGVWGLVLPKVDAGEDLRPLASLFSGTRNRPYILATIETAKGLVNAAEIAASPIVDGLIFGAADFARDTGMAYHEDVLEFPAWQMVLAARAARLPAFGLAGPLDDIRDMDRLRRLAQRSKRLGFCGAPAIHPAQIEVLEGAFAPSEEELARARAVVSQFEASDGLPSADDGRLVEWPIYVAACELLGIAPRDLASGRSSASRT